MNKSIKRKYDQFRKAGYKANDSLRYSKIWEQFEAREWSQYSDPEVGEVRLRAEDEQDSYFDVWGTPEAYTNIYGRRISEEQATKELEELLEREGVWCVVTEVWNGEEWEMVDSIGMCAGYSDVLSPVENCYVIDHMRAAIDRANELEEDQTEAEAQSWIQRLPEAWEVRV